MGKFGLYLLVALCAVFVFVSLPASQAWGYPVPPLPDDNLIINPWFRSAANPTSPGMDGWTSELTDGVGWGLSQKESNPAEEILLSGKCGFQPVYCGTGARWAHNTSGGVTQSYPNIDVYLFQDVVADPAHRELVFSMYWVNHRMDIVEVTVQGSNSVSEPFELVWAPIIISQDINPPPCCVPGHNGIPWFETGLLNTTLNTGYMYYRITLRARYPESSISQGNVGVKITGVYFSTRYSDAQSILSTPVVVHNPTVDPTYGPPTDPGGTVTSESTSTSTQPIPAPGITETPTPSLMPTATPQPSPTATPTVPEPDFTETSVPTPTPTASVIVPVSGWWVYLPIINYNVQTPQ